MSHGQWRRMRLPSALTISTVLLTTGCAHPLTIKNLSMYQPVSASSQLADVRLGVIANTTVPEEERLVLATVNALKRDGFRVVYPFVPSEESLAAVQYAARISTSSEYKGSGWNFLINWPGFLIWTPAWHGYNYGAQFRFDVDLADTHTNAELPRLSIPIDLDIRHAAFNRTWTEISWLEWSAIAFVGGLIFTRYDNSVTPLLLDAIEYKVGDYVASKIAASLNSYHETQPAGSPAT